MEIQKVTDFEWGRLVTVVETLVTNVTKLENKIDFMLKEVVPRKEFDALSTQVDSLEKQLTVLERVQSQGAILTKILWGGSGTLITVAITYILQHI